MNIVVITVNKLKEFPPIVTMLNILNKQGHNVSCITPAKDEFLNGNEHIKNLYIKEKPINMQERYPKPKIVASIAFRIDSFEKKIYMNQIAKTFRKEINDADIVWIAHEETVIAGGKRFINSLPDFSYTMYELPLKLGRNNKLYEYAAKKAKLLICPEYCRAHIMKAIYGRNDTPLIVPNKPECHPRTPKMKITNNEIRKRIDEIEASGKKIIMYMGILSGERPLGPIIEAVQSIRDEYEFVVLGPWSKAGEAVIKKYKEKFTYLGSLNPPEHLEVASHAYITYISYVPKQKSINAVFCAPNKVYEFAGFGVPMICNDVPGLKYIVENANMGICVSSLDVNSLVSGIREIEKNHEIMSVNANQYYESEDLNKMFKSVIDFYR